MRRSPSPSSRECVPAATGCPSGSEVRPERDPVRLAACGLAQTTSLSRKRFNLPPPTPPRLVESRHRLAPPARHPLARVFRCSPFSPWLPFGCSHLTASSVKVSHEYRPQPALRGACP